MGGLRTNRKLGIASVEPLEVFCHVPPLIIPSLFCPENLNIVTAVFPLSWWKDGRFRDGLFEFVTSPNKGGGA
jgi:hypothetical protein